MTLRNWNGTLLAGLAGLALAGGIAAGGGAAPAAEGTPSTPALEVKVEPLGVFPFQDRKQVEKFTVSPDGCRLAYVHKRSGKQVVIVDGKPSGPEWEMVVGEGLFFSPDSRRLAYIGRNGEKRHLVVDGVPGEAFDGIAAAGPVFSPDGRRAAYVAKRGASFVLVLDTHILATLDEAQTISITEPGPVFTPGGRHLVWAGALGGKKVVVVDGVPGPRLDDRSGDIELSPDGAHVAYWGLVEGRWHAVVDGRLEVGHAKRGRMAFSPDGARLACTAADGDRVILAVTGEPERSWPGELEDGPVFSPDGRHLAVAVRAEGRTRIIVDGQPREPGATWRVDRLTFSPDGTRLAYLGSENEREFLVVDGTPSEPLDGIRSRSLCFRPGGSRVYCIGYTGDLELAADWYLLEDGRRSEAWSAIWEDRPEFSAGGLRMAYHGGDGNTRCLVVDGTVHRDADYISAVRFSPDGKHWACVARREGKYFLVVDGKPGPEYPEVSNPSYSPDGRHLAYRAATVDKELVVLDDRPLPAWDMILDHGPTFRPDGSLEYAGMNRDGRTARVRVSFNPSAERGVRSTE